MNDLVMQRQCEELTIDEQLDAYDEQVIDDALRETSESLISVDGVLKVNLGLQLQSLYQKFTNETNPGVKQMLANKLGSLVSEEFRQRTKSWTAKDREIRYSQQVEEPVMEECPF